MASENPFDNAGSLATAVKDDPEQLTPPPLDAEVEDAPEPAPSGEKIPPTQIQPPGTENDVDVDIDGETTSENDGEDVVDADFVDDDDDQVDDAKSTELAAWTPPPFPSREPEWEHETIEFAGYMLNVRIPNSQALTGFTMATGEFISPMIKQAMVSKFVNLHFSPQSYAFLMTRMMDPDGDFNDDTFGELVRILVEKGGERVIAEAEAKAALEKKKQKRRKR